MSYDYNNHYELWISRPKLRLQTQDTLLQERYTQLLSRPQMYNSDTPKNYFMGCRMYRYTAWINTAHLARCSTTKNNCQGTYPKINGKNNNINTARHSSRLLYHTITLVKSTLKGVDPVSPGGIEYMATIHPPEQHLLRKTTCPTIWAIKKSMPIGKQMTHYTARMRPTEHTPES